MFNELLLQCSHKVIIIMDKQEIKKEIIPFYSSNKPLHDNLLQENFVSLEIRKLFLALDDLMDVIRQVEEEIQLFIFKKKENIVVGEHVEIREVSYFRLIFIKDDIPSYEDYDYKILFERDKFKKIMYSKLQNFKKTLNLPQKKLIYTNMIFYFLQQLADILYMKQ
ncbi:hypothetical protein [Candidatus Enterococcus ikei]|uniref:Uncharacterized protein n=1 Tax=Candidatus Enterococcus ikei TaxID=2815326 RepID=A0ABS3GVV7_9ENTE|nr:hypothetical protein [Enterococcus sp. DIV0869a]MBO0439392.1 hypothetical protein [Enterococcus sp. DIV0869a]